MTRRLVVAALALCAPLLASAQHFHQHFGAAPEDERRISPCVKQFAKPKLDAGIRKVSWKVSTSSPEAQAFFEQGVTLLYGFNYEDAMRNFRMAKDLDKDLAMASWGMAMAAGPNINLSMDEPCGVLALQESTRARDLAEEKHTQGKITELEYALARALPARYPPATFEPVEFSKATIAPVEYAVAMREVWNRFEPDPNVGALYAESLMNLRPWGLFNVALQPAIDTAVILHVLERAMMKDRNAVGPNHYWIHAVEAGPNPGSAKASADLLRHEVPASGHLLHMPSHTYMLTGDYAAAFDVNVTAWDVDKKQFGEACAGSYDAYSENPGCLQLYFGHYGAHNLFFRSVAALFAGRRASALQAARETQEHVQHFVANEPNLQRYMTAPLMVLVANRAWNEILNEPEPPTSCYIQHPFTKPDGCRILRATWHWARGMAYGAMAQRNAALLEYKELIAERKRILPPDPTTWGNNTAGAVLDIAEEMVLARVMWVEKKPEAAVEHLKLAVTHEDALAYDEPPQWFHPARQSLGGAYLALKSYARARAAFEDDLKRHPKNGRSLYGLARALEGLGDPSWHEFQKKYEEAWKTADYKMTEAELW